MSDKETAPWMKEAAESIALAALRYRTFQMPTHIAEIIASHCPVAVECTAPAPQPGPLCDNCGKPSRGHWCWIGLPKDENENYAPSERRGTSEQASPTPDHQRVGESAGEWIARCGMETVGRILTEERRKYGAGEVERG